MHAHWPLLAVLAAGLLVRLLVAVAYRPALFFSDSWLYVELAFGPSHFAAERPSGYPVLLWALGLPGRSLDVVTTLQHLAGIATAVLTYVFLRRFDVARWAATASAAVVVLDAYAVTLEQTILAEAFFTTALVASALLVAGEDPGRRRIAVGGLLLAAAVTMRTAAAFAVPVMLLYLAWRRHGARTLATAACAIVVPLMGYATIYHAKVGRFGLTAADGWFFYGRVGVIADCSRFKPPAETRDLCEPVERGRARGPLYYIWSGRSPANRKYGSVSAPGSSEPLRRFAMAVIQQRPLAYIELVLGDLVRYFRPSAGSPGHSDVAISLPEHPRTGRPWIDGSVRASYFPDYRAQVRPPAALARAYHTVVRPPRPVLGVLMLATVVALGLALLGRRRFAMPRRREAFLLTGMGVAIVLGATATSGFIVRYMIPSVPLIVGGGTLALADLLAAWRARPRLYEAQLGSDSAASARLVESP